MTLTGFANRIARIDLTTGTIQYEGIDPEAARKYIGARGLGVKYVFDNGPAVDPLSPENLLCFMNGPATGSAINMSGRLAVCTKSPLTGGVTDSHMGGWSAARLRWAGFDGLLFRGAAAAPVYAICEGGTVRLADASDLWGKGVRETVRILQERHGGKNVSVMAIGPAGENMVRYAAILNENDRAAGRGGTGAVMGSKKLKAVVAIGDIKDQWKPADDRKDAFEEARKAGLKAIMEGALTAPRKGGLSLYGTNVLMNIINEVGALPAFNGKETFHPNAEAISGEAIRAQYLVEEPTCHACPVACKKFVEIKEGPYAGVRTESFEYETAWALGVNCGLTDAGAVARLLDLCNDYGLDTIELGNVLSTTMEATELGLVAEGIAWGDAERMIEVTGLIARAEGELGKALGRGAYGAAVSFGRPDLANSVKGQAIPAYDPRGIKGIGLGYATSNRGACHLRGYTVASEIAGIPMQTDRLAPEGKGALLKTFQDLHAFSDSMDLCKFSAFSLGAEEYAMAYSAVTGVPFTAEDVMRTGERIYNLERYYNNLAGLGEGSDYLPKRFLTQPATGGSAGQVSELDQMLAEYYEARGWKNGVVPEEKLRELEII
ncbi:aldehyde:ferredoxin oxidoreductase [Symbiobacterium terraclitae]|uniref:Aldehyde:ferredoxin oxidoreductase n=1 Tax=Symbiobacterium terraclitae TaxID=557451 RepID=A0ABS4JV21_9FIRM|nr:aldehyde ferredoxin oxidoreductase family protein [Symbiobacterium terraclitae]MBP2019376.1 aldehyde:ferredoxin oxidoreductase [Symbiobacterium terraclitae]